MVQIFVQLEVLESGVHGGAAVALEVLPGVRGEDVGLYRDVIDEGLLAHGAAHTGRAEHLLGPGVVVGPGPAHVILGGVPAFPRPGLFPLPVLS